MSSPRRARRALSDPRSWRGRGPEQGDEGLEQYPSFSFRAHRPWALGTAEQQIRAYARNPPGRLPLSLGEFYPVPDVGLPESAIKDWLFVIADHLKRSIEEGRVR